MADSAYSRDVDELRAGLGGSVATLLAGTGFAISKGGGQGRRRVVGGDTRAAAGASGKQLVAGAASSSGEGVLSDERSMRALAKQIKRLITEDARRGIGI